MFLSIVSAAFPPRARLGKDADTKIAKGIFAQRAAFSAPFLSYSLARPLALRTVPAVVAAAEAEVAVMSQQTQQSILVLTGP